METFGDNVPVGWPGIFIVMRLVEGGLVMEICSKTRIICFLQKVKQEESCKYVCDVKDERGLGEDDGCIS